MDRKYRMAVMTLGVLAVLISGIGTAARSAIHLSVVDFDFSYDPDSGASLSVFGIPVIGGSSFWVVKTGWTGHIYGAPLQPDLLSEADIEDVIGGTRITLHHYLSPIETSPFIGTETYTLYRSNVVKVALEFTYTGTDSAIYEWNLGKIEPLPIIGQPWRATFDTIEQSGTIPYIATSRLHSMPSMIGKAYRYRSDRFPGWGNSSIDPASGHFPGLFPTTAKTLGEPAPILFLAGGMTCTPTNATGPMPHEVTFRFPPVSTARRARFLIQHLMPRTSGQPRCQGSQPGPAVFTPTTKSLNLYLRTLPASDFPASLSGRGTLR
jgi:hypothetical protein